MREESEPTEAERGVGVISRAKHEVAEGAARVLLVVVNDNHTVRDHRALRRIAGQIGGKRSWVFARVRLAQLEISEILTDLGATC